MRSCSGWLGNGSDHHQHLALAHGITWPVESGDNSGMASLVPLIELLRGGTLECVHFGAVAVADAQGKLGRAARAIRSGSAFRARRSSRCRRCRSCRAAGPGQLGFSREHVAMMCASHSGEPMHVAQVDGMLDKAGLTYKALQCGCHVPLFADAGVAPAPAPGSYDERHHNCSGKHAGFLACCVQHGWPVGQLPGARAIRCSRRSGATWRGPSGLHPRT